MHYQTRQFFKVFIIGVPSGLLVSAVVLAGLIRFVPIDPPPLRYPYNTLTTWYAIRFEERTLQEFPAAAPTTSAHDEPSSAKDLIDSIQANPPVPLTADPPSLWDRDPLVKI